MNAKEERIHTQAIFVQNCILEREKEAKRLFVECGYLVPTGPLALELGAHVDALGATLDEACRLVGYLREGTP